MVSNREKGDAFQRAAAEALQRVIGVPFELEVRIPIGSPPKPHTFDLATADRRFVGEAKAFTWTAGGNIPSAKITTLREAAQYLSLLPKPTLRFIIMARDCHAVNGRPLADYFPA